ncbi:hypothetical protein AMAG_11611 [Allomyces macrogynus ATCC 38327]|uniref:TRAF-type domain-containing protein n=1 Tax=Allomyces macrogynus (strain ATCC 38327) TaxID=578462 RepID=A0A0L0SV90_ALLM3|nr:hypothetical protein, variant [Allomyces macrogynus ATCC 38327]KNE66473.1 hypothetical protein AMAG_11611 [Allomyces macrogynus ATCC 38327]|eukprot:KNE66472.1 hypothetical protein, variant [Allomyces macrogynus ATCC 38327]
MAKRKNTERGGPLKRHNNVESHEQTTPAITPSLPDSQNVEMEVDDTPAPVPMIDANGAVEPVPSPTLHVSQGAEMAVVKVGGPEVAGSSRSGSGSVDEEPIVDIWQLQAGIGDAAVVRIQQANKPPFTMVIDTGHRAADFQSLVDQVDAEELDINVVVISHGDEDHFGGLTKTFDNWLKEVNERKNAASPKESAKKTKKEHEKAESIKKTAEKLKTRFANAFFIVNWYGSVLRNNNDPTKVTTKGRTMSQLVTELNKLEPERNRVMNTRFHANDDHSSGKDTKPSGVWYPPQGFLVGVDLFKLWCEPGAMQAVFDAYNQCYGHPINDAGETALKEHNQKFKIVEEPAKPQKTAKELDNVWATAESVLKSCWSKKGDPIQVACVAFQEHFFNGTEREPIPNEDKNITAVNRGSVGLLIRAWKLSFLTMGDLGFHGEVLVAQSLHNLLPDGDDLLMHKISHHGSHHSTISQDEAQTDLFQQTGFKPRIILVSHGLNKKKGNGAKKKDADTNAKGKSGAKGQKQPADGQVEAEHPSKLVVQAIMDYLEKNVAIALFTNRKPSIGQDPNSKEMQHLRFVTTGAENANAGFNQFRNTLMKNSQHHDTDSIVGAESKEYDKRPGVHVYVFRQNGEGWHTVFVEFYKNPRLRRAVLDPYHVCSFDLMAGHTAVEASLRNHWLDMVPFGPALVAVPGINLTGMSAEDDSLVLDLSAVDFAIRFGHPAMRLAQLRVTVQRAGDAGAQVLAFDAQLQVDGAEAALRMRLQESVQYTEGSPQQVLTLVECDTPSENMVFALLRDHSLFQALASRFPWMWARVQDKVKEAHVTLQFLPLAFDVVGQPVPTLFVELKCQFDAMKMPVIIQLCTEFLPCPRVENGQYQSLPMWSIKLVGALDLAELGHNDPDLPSEIEFFGVVQGRGDMEAHLFPPRNLPIGKLANALTGIELLTVIDGVIPGKLMLDDVWIKASSDLKAKMSRKDLQEVGVALALEPSAMPECLAFLNNYTLKGQATVRPDRADNKWQLATVSLALVMNMTDNVLNLPDCPIQGSSAGGLRLQSISVTAHLLVSPLVAVQFVVADDMEMTGVEDAPVAVHECLGELFLGKDPVSGWKLTSAALSAKVTLGTGHSARINLQMDQSDEETNWSFALQAVCDDAKPPNVPSQASTRSKQQLLALPPIDGSDQLERAPKRFQLYSADMEFNLFKSSAARDRASWSVFGHGELAVGFSTAVHLPGGSKLFDLSGMVMAKVIVPPLQPLRAEFASDLAVSWDDPSAANAKACVLARVKWTEGVETLIALRLLGYNLHHVAPDWLQFIVPKGAFAIDFGYERSQNPKNRDSSTTRYLMHMTISNKQDSWFQGDSIQLQIETTEQGTWDLKANFDGSLNLMRLVGAAETDSSAASVVLTMCNFEMHINKGEPSLYCARGAIAIKKLKFTVQANLARTNGHVSAWALAGHAHVPLGALAELFPWMPHVNGEAAVDIVVACAVNKMEIPNAPDGFQFDTSLGSEQGSALAKRVAEMAQPASDAFTFQFSINDLNFVHMYLEGVSAKVIASRSRSTKENDDAATTIGFAINKGSDMSALYGGKFCKEHKLALVGTATFGRGQTEVELMGTANPPFKITVIDVIKGINPEIQIGHEVAGKLLNSFGIELAAVALAIHKDGIRLSVDGKLHLGQDIHIPLIVMLDKRADALGLRIACFPKEHVDLVQLVDRIVDLSVLRDLVGYRILWVDLQSNWRSTLAEFGMVSCDMPASAPHNDASLRCTMSTNGNKGWAVSAGIRVELGRHWRAIGLQGVGIEGIVSVGSDGKVTVSAGLPSFRFAALKFDSNKFIFEEGAMGASVSATISTPSGQPWASFQGQVLIKGNALAGSLMLCAPQAATRGTAEEWMDLGQLDQNLKGCYLGPITAQVDTSIAVPKLTAAGSMMFRHPALKCDTTFSIAVQLPPVSFFFCSATHVSLLTIIAMFIKDGSVLDRLKWMETFLPVLQGIACLLKTEPTEVSLDVLGPAIRNLDVNDNKEISVAKFTEYLASKNALKEGYMGAAFFCDWKLFGAEGTVQCAAIGSKLASLAVCLHARLKPIKIRLAEGKTPILTLCGLDDNDEIDLTQDLLFDFELDTAKGMLELDAKIFVQVSLFVTASVKGTIQFRKDKKGVPSLRISVQFKIGSENYAIVLDGSFFCRFAALPLPSNGAAKAAIDKWAPALKLAMVPTDVGMDLGIWGEKNNEKACIIECMLLALKESLTGFMRTIEDKMKQAERELDKHSGIPLFGWICSVASWLLRAARALVSTIRKGFDLIGSFLAKLAKEVIQIRELHVGGALGAISGAVAYISFDVSLFGHDIKGGLRVAIGADIFKTIANFFSSLLSNGHGGQRKEPGDYHARLDEDGNSQGSEGGRTTIPKDFELKRIEESDREKMQKWAERIDKILEKLEHGLKEKVESMPEKMPPGLGMDAPEEKGESGPEQSQPEPNESGPPNAKDKPEPKDLDLSMPETTPAQLGKYCNLDEVNPRAELLDLVRALEAKDASDPPQSAAAGARENNLLFISCPQCKRIIPEDMFDDHLPKCRPFVRCTVEGCDKLLRETQDRQEQNQDFSVACPSCKSRVNKSHLAHHLQAECKTFQIAPVNNVLSAWSVECAAATAAFPRVLLAASPSSKQHVVITKSTQSHASSLKVQPREPCPYFGCSYTWASWSTLEQHLSTCPHVIKSQCVIPNCTALAVATNKSGVDWEHIFLSCTGSTLMSCHVCGVQALGPRQLVKHLVRDCKSKSRNCTLCGEHLHHGDDEASHLQRDCKNNHVTCPVDDCKQTFAKRDEQMHFKDHHPEPLDEINPNARGPFAGHEIEYGSTITRAPSQFIMSLIDTEVPELNEYALYQLATESVAVYEDMQSEFQCRARCGVHCTSADDEEWHVRHKCDMSRVPCLFCRMALPFKDMEAHHANECPYALCRCPRTNCLSPEVPRHQLGQHMAVECDQAPAVCLFCPARVTSDALGHHVFADHDTCDKTLDAPIACRQPACGQKFNSGSEYLVHLLNSCSMERCCSMGECTATMPANQIGRHWANECEHMNLQCASHRDQRFDTMAKWLSHRIDAACNGNKDLRTRLARLDPAPPKTTIQCPLQCGATAVKFADLFTHLVDGVNGSPPCAKFDVQECCPHLKCTATFHRSHRAHHLAHECEFEMEMCKMCSDQYVAKDREEHWTVCPKAKRLHVEYQLRIPREQSQLPNFTPKVQFTWDGQPLIHENHFQKPYPHLRGYHLMVIDPVPQPGGSWRFETQHWGFDLHDEQRPPWFAQNSEPDSSLCAPGTTVASVLEELTLPSAPPFRVIADAVVERQPFKDREVAAIAHARLIELGAVVQMRPGLSGREVIALPTKSTVAQDTCTAEVMVPWA